MSMMMRFLSNSLKSCMLTSSLEFHLKSLSSEMSFKWKILTRSTNEISCGILTDVAVSRTDKSFRRDKAKDLVFLTTKNQEDVHVHEKHEKLITRSEVL
jgi:hypothetical protein